MKMRSILFLSVWLFAAPAEAQVTVKSNNPAASLLQSLIQNCMQQKLGQEGANKAKAMALQMNEEVVQQCKAGQAAAARTVAVSYSQTNEGMAAMDCAKRLKPYITGPSVQQMLGGYAPMVNELTSGQVPQNLCSQVSTSGAPYGGVQTQEIR